MLNSSSVWVVKAHVCVYPWLWIDRVYRGLRVCGYWSAGKSGLRNSLETRRETSKKMMNWEQKGKIQRAKSQERWRIVDRGEYYGSKDRIG